MFDTHVNLHGEAFQDDLNETLDRARAAGISRFMAICDRFDNFPAVYAIALQNEDMWCSAGIHPHHAKDFQDFKTQTLIDAAQDPKVAAIGESGLDFHYNYSDEASQISSFRRHIEAARETDLPLIIHSREADELMGDILEEEMNRGVFKPLLHCYTGSLRLAQRALKIGAFFSTSGIVSFKNAHNVREVFSQIPIDKVILETDCPYLAPMPHRGRRNEPAFLVNVCQAYANLMGLSEAEAAKQTELNALALFSKVT